MLRACGVENVLAIIVDTENDQRRVARPFAENLGCLDTRQGWHIDVHQHHVRLQALSQGNALAAITRLPHDLDVLAALQTGREAVEHEAVVIDQQDTDHLAHADSNSEGDRRNSVFGTPAKSVVPLNSSASR